MILVVFDIDGTVVDSQHMIVAAQAEAFAAVGLPAPGRERALSVVGLSLAQAFTALVGPDGPVAELAEAYKGAFSRLRAEAAIREPLFPGAADLIARLRASPAAVLGIATGKSRRGVDHLVATHGWDGWVRDDPDRGRRALEAASGDAGTGDGRDRVAPRRHRHDRRFDLRHGDGPRGRRHRPRGGLGLPHARGADRGRADRMVASYAELERVLVERGI